MTGAQMEDVTSGEGRSTGAKRSRDEDDAATNGVTPNGLEPPAKAHKSDALTSPRLASRQATPPDSAISDSPNSLSPSKNGDGASTRSRSESLSPSDEDGADDTEDVGADDTEDGDGDEDDDMDNENDMDIVGDNAVAVMEPPTKPPNSGYMIWIQNRRQEIKAADAASGDSTTKTLKEFGAEWAALDEAEKAVWEGKKQALVTVYKAELAKYNAYVAKNHPNGFANGSSADVDEATDGGDADRATNPNGFANGSSADADDAADGGDADQAANGIVGHRSPSQMIAAMQIKIGMVKSLTNMFGRDPDSGDVVTKIPKETVVLITKATGRDTDSGNLVEKIPEEVVMLIVKAAVCVYPGFLRLPPYKELGTGEELFCEWYSRATFDYAKSKKRKTISINDLFIVNERYSQLEFLKAAYSPQLREKVRAASQARDKEAASSRAARRQQKKQAEAAASADPAQAAESSESGPGAKDSANAPDNQSDNSSTSSASSSSAGGGKSSRGRKPKPAPVVNPKAQITNFFKKKAPSADENGSSANAADDSTSVSG